MASLFCSDCGLSFPRKEYLRHHGTCRPRAEATQLVLHAAFGAATTAAEPAPPPGGGAAYQCYDGMMGAAPNDAPAAEGAPVSGPVPSIVLRRAVPLDSAHDGSPTVRSILAIFNKTCAILRFTTKMRVAIWAMVLGIVALFGVRHSCFFFFNAGIN